MLCFKILSYFQQTNKQNLNCAVTCKKEKTTTTGMADRIMQRP